MQRLAFQGLEPCDGKLSRTVLRGKRGRKAPALPGSFLPKKGTPISSSLIVLIAEGAFINPLILIVLIAEGAFINPLIFFFDIKSYPARRIIFFSQS
jgi:hypothetical protein